MSTVRSLLALATLTSCSFVWAQTAPPPHPTNPTLSSLGVMPKNKMEDSVRQHQPQTFQVSASKTVKLPVRVEEKLVPCEVFEMSTYFDVKECRPIR